jgi:hypothetical protein
MWSRLGRDWVRSRLEMGREQCVRKTRCGRNGPWEGEAASSFRKKKVMCSIRVGSVLPSYVLIACLGELTFSHLWECTAAASLRFPVTLNMQAHGPLLLLSSEPASRVFHTSTPLSRSS